MFRPPRTHPHKWPILLAVSTLPLAVVVAAATATMSTPLGLLIYPSALLFGAFMGSWTLTVRDGFAGGFMVGWAGFFLGLLVGTPLQYAANPDAGWLGFPLAVVFGGIVGAVLGLLLGLIAGAAGALAAKAKLGRKGIRSDSPPSA